MTPPLVIEMTVVRVKAAEDMTVDRGPGQPVLCLAVDDANGSRVDLRRTVATQFPVGTRLSVTVTATPPYGLESPEVSS